MASENNEGSLPVRIGVIKEDNSSDQSGMQTSGSFPQSIPVRLGPMPSSASVSHNNTAPFNPMSPIRQREGRSRSNSLGGLSPVPGGAPNRLFQVSSRSVPTSPVGIRKPLMIPGLPAPIPSDGSKQRKAMEAAAMRERERAKLMEQQEANLSADELRAILKRERHRMAGIAADLAGLRATAVESQLEAEVIEEGRINALMRRLDKMQHEKGQIILELEREEEMLTNTLQKKLNQVRTEKALLENQIENEKKSHTLLQKKLSGLRDSHLAIAEALEEQEEIEEEE